MSANLRVLCMNVPILTLVAHFFLSNRMACILKQRTPQHSPAACRCSNEHVAPKAGSGKHEVAADGFFK
jgi:hypothetical protein